MVTTNFFMVKEGVQEPKLTVTTNFFADLDHPGVTVMKDILK